MNGLGSLDLSNKQMNREIPEHLVIGCLNLKNLSWLKLDDNLFIGKTLKKLFNCSIFRGLNPSNNNISGKVSSNKCI